MMAQELLAKLEREHVVKAMLLVDEVQNEIDRKKFALLGLRKLEVLEDDAWKRVASIDAHLNAIQKQINSVYFYDEFEMRANDKVGMLAALIELERKVIAARRKLTDVLIREIVNREKDCLAYNGQ